MEGVMGTKEEGGPLPLHLPTMGSNTELVQCHQHTALGVATTVPLQGQPIAFYTS